MISRAQGSNRENRQPPSDSFPLFFSMALSERVSDALVSGGSGPSIDRRTSASSNGKETQQEYIKELQKESHQRRQAFAMQGRRSDRSSNGASLSKLVLEFDGPCRAAARRLLTNTSFDVGMGLVIVFNIGLMVLETNANANPDCEDGSKCGPVAHVVLNDMLLAVYTIETALRFFVLRSEYFKSFWNVLDLSIVTVGFFDLIITKLALSDALPNVQMIRFFRVLRLARAVRIVEKSPELNALVRGFASAMSALCWGFLLIIVMFVILAILTVEVVGPQNKSIAHEEEWCYTAFESVQDCVLLFFQTMLAGDAWGTCALPIIRAFWPSAVLFVFAYVAVQLGLTNLILSVIVDNAAQARDADVGRRIKEKERADRDAVRQIRKVFRKIDMDESGTITLDELITSYQTEPLVQQIFKSLNITEADLDSIFELMDVDDSEEVDYEEFASTIQKALVQDMRMQMLETKVFLSQFFKKISKEVALVTTHSSETAEHILRVVAGISQGLNIDISSSSLDCHKLQQLVSRRHDAQIAAECRQHSRSRTTTLSSTDAAGPVTVSSTDGGSAAAWGPRPAFMAPSEGFDEPSGSGQQSGGSGTGSPTPPACLVPTLTVVEETHFPCRGRPTWEPLGEVRRARRSRSDSSLSSDSVSKSKRAAALEPVDAKHTAEEKWETKQQDATAAVHVVIATPMRRRVPRNRNRAPLTLAPQACDSTAADAQSSTESVQDDLDILSLNGDCQEGSDPSAAPSQSSSDSTSQMHHNNLPGSC